MSGYRMYYFTDYRKRGYKDFRAIVVDMCEQFEERMGYKPRSFIMRQDDYTFQMGKKSLKLKLWVTLVKDGIQPGHFQLGPLVKRTPILDVERTPV